jgi:hypothetical protein
MPQVNMNTIKPRIFIISYLFNQNLYDEYRLFFGQYCIISCWLWLLALWLLAVGCWLFGYWLLALWLLAIGSLAVG